MAKSFSEWAGRLSKRLGGGRLTLRDPQVVVRFLLGMMLLANLVAAYFVFQPLGGSVDELDRQAVTLQGQISARQAGLARRKVLAEKVAARGRRTLRRPSVNARGEPQLWLTG